VRERVTADRDKTQSRDTWGVEATYLARPASANNIHDLSRFNFCIIFVTSCSCIHLQRGRSIPTFYRRKDLILKKNFRVTKSQRPRTCHFIWRLCCSLFESVFLPMTLGFWQCLQWRLLFWEICCILLYVVCRIRLSFATTNGITPLQPWYLHHFTQQATIERGVLLETRATPTYQKYALIKEMMTSLYLSHSTYSHFCSISRSSSATGCCKSL